MSTPMKLLVVGRTGQLAMALARLPGPDLSVTTVSRAEADLADPAACAACVAGSDADVVVNAAAYTAVDRAESEPELADIVNGDAPGAMAAAAAARGLPFLHVSTDYVFDGSGDRPWTEADPVAPLGAYGRSKLRGERLVAQAGGPHVVLRTAWVFSADGANFVKTMLRLGATRDRLTVVDDQRGGPTAAADIAAALAVIARAFVEGRGRSGVLHYAGAPTVSWCGFAEAIFERAVAAGMIARRPEVAPIRSADWPTPAPRPGNSSLDCRLIAETYGLAQPDWRPALDAVLAALAAENP